MKEKLINIIREAFSGVVLGSGIGLWQAQAIDDYKTELEIAKAREKDEKTDWQKIPLQDFVSCETSLSFFDAEGVRFHLPGFLIADLEGADFAHELFLNFSEKSRELFMLLDNDQRFAVLQYLLYQKEKLQKEKYFDENDYHFQQLLATIENWRRDSLI